jgi:hypothetical protein
MSSDLRDVIAANKNDGFCEVNDEPARAACTDNVETADSAVAAAEDSVEDADLINEASAESDAKVSRDVRERELSALDAAVDEVESEKFAGRT